MGKTTVCYRGVSAMNYGYIYCITNLNNKKKYIGMTTRSIEERFQEHVKAGSYIGNALRKHGVDNFIVEEIDRAGTKELLCEKEIYWIDKYNAFTDGYNLTVGGEGVDNVDRITVTLTGEQKKFDEYVRGENKKDVDVSDNTEMMKAVLLNIMVVYLNANKITDKRSAARFIGRLKQEYIKAIKDVGIIDFNELKLYL